MRYLFAKSAPSGGSATATEADMLERYPRATGATSTALALLTVGLVSCRDATQVAFEVRTDLSCAEVNDTSITVGTVDDVDRKPATSTAVKTTCVDGRIGALV